MKKEDILNAFSESIESEEVIGNPFTIDKITFIPIIDKIMGVGIINRHIVGGGGFCLIPKALIMINQDSKVSLFSFKNNDTIDEIKEKLPTILGDLEEIV